jgi:HK97 family phage prohead protease
MSARRFFGGSVEPLGDLEVLVVASTPQLARDGHILEPGGADLETYRSNPIVLWQHDPKSPVGTCSAVGIDDNGNLAARVTFAPIGISSLADQIRALVKSGVVGAVSVGFDPIDGVPIDPKRPRGGQRITRWALLELSFVSIPADTGAKVTARFHGTRADLLATLDRLPAIPVAAVQRAAARLPSRGSGPIIDHANQVWLLQQAERDRERERERRYSKERRQQDLRELGRFTTH